MYQGCGHSPPFFSGTKLVAATWWLYAIVLFHTYNGALVAFLSIPKQGKTINTLQELAEQQELKWTFLKGSAHQNLFNEFSNSDIYRTIGKGASDLVNSSQQGLKFVLSGHYAFIKEKSYLDYMLFQDYNKTHSCRMHKAREEFFKVGFGFALQQRSPYLHIINKGIKRMLHNGLVEKWKRRYWPKTGNCDMASDQNTISLENLQGIFLVYAVGIVLSAIILCTEYALHSKRNQKLKSEG
ncbi:glutamate receptor ionotropic, delta-2-like [Tachypleus tridentatus]|uniref:glutamate receptor ionotropic, delta-2-like n=1 Tax=Tachypleus tridentatus TaxID=6853 RepID=UPI003FD5FE3A